VAISGLWQAQNGADALSGYAGPLQWGHGTNPIHGVSGQDAPGRVLDPGDAGATPPPEALLGPTHWGYEGGDYIGGIADVDLRHVPGTEHGWDETADRGAVPANYPEWGPYGDPETENWDFPVSGPPGGTDWREIPHRSRQEAGLTNEVLPAGASSGGYQSKGLLGEVEAAAGSDPGQYVINTSDVQGPGVKAHANDRATARGTDVPRASTVSRIRGQRLRRYAHGAPGPDMFPYQQSLIVRPFVFRTVGASVPPPGGYSYMTGSQVAPIQRTTPPDPYQGVDETAVGGGDYGYTFEEGGLY
jgi:hypothetical protein